VICLAELREAPQVDSRGYRRRSLHLTSNATSNAASHRVLIHDLSENGMMIETSAPFEIGERFDVELPETGNVTVTVVWRDGFRLGCEFERNLSRAAVSAAQLLSPFHPSVQQAFDVNASIENATHHVDQFPSRVHTSPMATTAMVILLLCVTAFASALATAPFSHL
jgi:PilZ domain